MKYISSKFYYVTYHLLKRLLCLDDTHYTYMRLLDTLFPAVSFHKMDFYEDSLQRFLFATGVDKTYLTKNVMSSGRINTLLARFPDAKVVYNCQTSLCIIAFFCQHVHCAVPIAQPVVALYFTCL